MVVFISVPVVPAICSREGYRAEQQIKEDIEMTGLF